jgi:hypothetical protein
MRSLILFTTLSALIACGKSPESAPPKSTSAVLEAPQQLPPFQKPNWTARSDPSLPVIDNEAQIMTAIDMIIEYEGDPRLQTSDDHAAMKLLHAYHDRRRALNLVIFDAKDALGMPGRTAYACQGDLYALKSDLRSSMPMFMIVLYHEVQHAAICDANLARLGIRRDQADANIDVDPCLGEPAPYSASVRLLSAMIDHGKQPTDFSPLDDGDLGSLNGLYEAWRALSENRFCRWYRSLSLTVQPSAAP